MDEHFATLLESVRDAASPVRALDEIAALNHAADWEALGRVVDAQRAVIAADIAARSRAELGSAGLAAQYGKRNASQLLESEVLCRWVRRSGGSASVPRSPLERR